MPPDPKVTLNGDKQRASSEHWGDHPSHHPEDVLFYDILDSSRLTLAGIEAKLRKNGRRGGRVRSNAGEDEDGFHCGLGSRTTMESPEEGILPVAVTVSASEDYSETKSKSKSQSQSQSGDEKNNAVITGMEIKTDTSSRPGKEGETGMPERRAVDQQGTGLLSPFAFENKGQSKNQKEWPVPRYFVPGRPSTAHTVASAPQLEVPSDNTDTASSFGFWQQPAPGIKTETATALPTPSFQMMKLYQDTNKSQGKDAVMSRTRAEDGFIKGVASSATAAAAAAASTHHHSLGSFGNSLREYGLQSPKTQERRLSSISQGMTGDGAATMSDPGALGLPDELPSPMMKKSALSKEAEPKSQQESSTAANGTLSPSDDAATINEFELPQTRPSASTTLNANTKDNVTATDDVLSPATPPRPNFINHANVSPTSPPLLPEPLSPLATPPLYSEELASTLAEFGRASQRVQELVAAVPQFAYKPGDRKKALDIPGSIMDTKEPARSQRHEEIQVIASVQTQQPADKGKDKCKGKSESEKLKKRVKFDADAKSAAEVGEQPSPPQPQPQPQQRAKSHDTPFRAMRNSINSIF